LLFKPFASLRLCENKKLTEYRFQYNQNNNNLLKTNTIYSTALPVNRTYTLVDETGNQNIKQDPTISSNH